MSVARRHTGTTGEAAAGMEAETSQRSRWTPNCLCSAFATQSTLSRKPDVRRCLPDTDPTRYPWCLFSLPMREETSCIRQLTQRRPPSCLNAYSSEYLVLRNHGVRLERPGSLSGLRLSLRRCARQCRGPRVKVFLTIPKPPALRRRLFLVPCLSVQHPV